MFRWAIPIFVVFSSLVRSVLHVLFDLITLFPSIFVCLRRFKDKIIVD